MWLTCGAQPPDWQRFSEASDLESGRRAGGVEEVARMIGAETGTMTSDAAREPPGLARGSARYKAYLLADC